MMRREKRIVAAFVLVLMLFLPLAAAHGSAFAGTEPVRQADFAKEIEKIERFVINRMKEEGAVGLTIGFIRDDFVWVKGFGYADLENKVPAKPESSYRMASVTKPMTAVGILTLVEQGKIDLDAEVQKYVPYFPKKKHPVTIRQLLGHLGGISHYRNYDLEGHFKDHKNTREAIAVFENFELIAEPGTRYNYSSYGFNLLGAVIEGASGKSYGEYMAENVWGPLGMKDTRLDDPLAIIPNRVAGYRMIGGDLRHSEFVDISSRFAGGGTRSTVPDMLGFARGLFEGKILSDRMRYEMWTGQTTRGGRNIGYGYGWGTNTGNGRFIVGHGGSQAETKTSLIVVPHKKFAAAVAINFEQANPTAYTRGVFEIVLDEPWQIRYYAASPRERALLRGMDAAFDYGLRYYDRFGRPQTNDREELKAAFAYFNKTLTAPPDEARRMLGEGSHPAAGEAFVKMVSYMADRLKANGADPETYYQKGAIPLFSDYIVWYRSAKDHPGELKFDETFELMAVRWNADWEKTWTADTRELEIDSRTDFATLGKRLTKTFSGASVYPDYTAEFENQIRDRAIAGEIRKALEIAQTAFALYPGSDETNANLGILHVITGEKEKGMALLKKAVEMDPDGAAGARNLNNAAYSLGRAGQGQAGLLVLHAAVELHPRVANLYDSIGDFNRRMGNRERAIEFYQKALAVDPDYPNARAAREMLEKLKQK